MHVIKPLQGESQSEFMNRSVPQLILDKKSQEQAIVVSMDEWRKHHRSAKSGQIEDRAYSFITVKTVNEDQRIISGTATTPTPDRAGDIVVSEGARFKLPLPLLWQHDSKQPIGHVTKATVTNTGIDFEAQLVKIDEPGLLQDRLNEAWQSLKVGLVRAVSIGFMSLKWAFIKDGNGIEFTEWEWLELSAVTIPANVDANIAVVKSFDCWNLSASGSNDSNNPKQTPGVSGKTSTVVLGGSRKEGVKTMAKTIVEQIREFEATRQSKSARMHEIMNKAAETGATLDEAEATEYDDLQSEIESIDKHLKRLADINRLAANSAVDVSNTGNNANDASRARGGESRDSVVFAKKDLPKGTAFTRYAIALAKSQGNLMQAVEISKVWHDSTPEVETVLRAAVAAGTTTDSTWAAPLVEYQIMASEFIELLRPATIIGKIVGLRKVPFNIKMPRALTGTSVNWVGEGKSKPVSGMTFDSVTLRYTKAAGIVVLTDELVRFSNPSAEAVVRQDLIDSMAQFLDEDFVDPAKAAVSNVSPASITNGIVPVTSSGTSADALRADVKDLFANMLSNNISPAGSVWIMSELQALAMTMMMNPLGQREFPDVTINGGTLLGLPVVLSGSVPAGIIILAKASEIFLADDGDVTLDASREASLQMSSSPSDGSTELVSLWQNNMVALRAERYINWKRRRDAAVQYINGANYGGVTS